MKKLARSFIALIAGYRKAVPSSPLHWQNCVTREPTLFAYQSIPIPYGPVYSTQNKVWHRHRAQQTCRSPPGIDSIRLAGAVTILNTSKWLNPGSHSNQRRGRIGQDQQFPRIAASPIASRRAPGGSFANNKLNEPLYRSAGDPFDRNPGIL